MRRPKGLKLTSVRVWLTLWNIGVLALVLIGFALAVRFTIQKNIVNRVNESTAMIAHRIQKGFADGDYPPRGWMMGPPSESRNDAHNPNSTFAQFRPSLLALDGKPLDPTRKDRLWDRKGLTSAAAGIERYTSIIVDKQPVRVFSAPLKRDGEVLGVVQAAMPLTDVHHTVTWVNDALRRLIPLALLAAGIGGALLTYRAMRPVRKLASAAEKIEAGNLSGRLPVGGGDEFAELATTFNNMLDRLEVSFRRLEQSHDQQRRFVGDASHELKTPLTAIKAHTSLALSSDRTPEQYKKTIASIDQAADRMSRIIQDLLILARADAGQLEVKPEPAVLVDIVNDAIETVRQPNAAPIRFDRSLCAIRVLGEPDSLIRLFVNLLNNAVRHTPQTGTISITAIQSGEQVRIAVSDTGDGIAEEHLPHLTKRFYRVDTARARVHGGTGLGLAICQTIVDAHHGTLTIDSTVGAGTTVTIALPALLPRA